MRDFSYTALPGRVVFGAGAARTRLADEVARLGALRILVIAAGAERELTAGLVRDVPVAAKFDDVRAHVPAEIAQRVRGGRSGRAAVHRRGSTTGTAQAVVLQTGLPIAAVPTTYAGSEMTPAWGYDGGATQDHRQ
jgi:maleylacetate reductase